MAHIDQIPSLFFLVYGQNKMSVEDGLQWIRKKLQRSFEKLCPEAKEIIKYKYEAFNQLVK